MLHACFVLTILCFVYTLRYFYIFSWTNLLTICCSVGCMFSAIFGFGKARKEILSELDGTKAKVNILPERTRSLEERRGGATRRTHLGLARVPWPRQPLVWASRGSTNLALSPIYTSPRDINPNAG